MEWPSGLRCDLVDIPLESGCGVIAHMEALSLQPCPVAQVGERLLLLVAEGSTRALGLDLDGLPTGLVMHRAVGDLPGLDDVDGCWVIPPPSHTDGMPLASAVVEAVRSAYAEYRAVHAGSA